MQETEIPAGPTVLHVDAEAPLPGEVLRLVEGLRDRADAFVFLSGGASAMSDADRQALFGLFRCFEIMAERGLRFAVAEF